MRAITFSGNTCHCEESSTKQSPAIGEMASQRLAMTAPCRGYHYRSFCTVISLVIVLFFCPTLPINAQQPVAVLQTISGEVWMALQGQTPVTATTEIVLRAGDTLDIRAGASVIVRLSDGSELQIGQNTKFDIVELTRRTEDKSRMTRLKLWWGKITCFIAPAHQVAGSAFTVETPNAEAGVKFSQPVIEVSYDPITGASLFKAYTVTLVMTNRKTRKVESAPPESQITIQEDATQITPLPAGEPLPVPQSDLQELPADALSVTSQAPSTGEGQETDPATSQVPSVGQRISSLRETLMQQGMGSVRGATSSSPPVAVPVGNGGSTTAETSSNPSPGTRPETPRQPVPVTVIIGP